MELQATQTMARRLSTAASTTTTTSKQAIVVDSNDAPITRSSSSSSNICEQTLVLCYAKMWSSEPGELGDEFCERMNQLIEKQHTDWQPQSRLLTLVVHLCRLFWCYMGRFCQIDLYGGLQSYTPNTWGWKYRENFDRRYWSVDKVRWWPYLAYVLYAYSSIRLMVNTYFQYVHDVYFLPHEVLKALTTHDNKFDVRSQIRSNMNTPYVRYIQRLVAEQSGGRNPQAATRQLADLSSYLSERVTWAHGTLKYIGAPYISLHFMEIIYEFMFQSTFVLIVVLSIYYSRIKPFNYGLTRAFLDLKHERRVQNRLIINELNKFIASSRIFTQTCIAQLKYYSREQQLASDNIMNGKNRSSSNGGSGNEWAAQQGNRAQLDRVESNKFLLDHILMKKQIKQMALNGMLLPIHRTQKWVDRTSILAVFIDLLGMFYSLLGTLFFAFFFFYLSDEMDIEMSLIDITVIVEAGIQVAFIIPIGLFFITQIIANCIDQIYYSVNICNQIRDCIATNRDIFQQVQELQRLVMLNECASRVVPADETRTQVDSSVSLDSETSRGQHRDGGPFHFGGRTSSFSRTLRGRTSIVYSEQACRLRTKHKELTNQLDDRLALSETNIGPTRSGLVATNQLERRDTLSHLLLIESHCTRMNSELLKVFMHYKIFVAQIKPLNQSFGTFACAILLLLTLMPLDIRMHSPYMDHTTKLYSMSFNLLCATITDLCFIPLCYMYSRCLDLYKCLSSLLAHVIDVAAHRQQTGGGGGGGEAGGPADELEKRSPTMGGQPLIYDAHTIWLLRKELNHPHQLANQFVIYGFNVRLTYGNLLRIHFWVGILTLSMVVDASSGQEFFGRLFNDPVGLFEWVPTKLNRS